MKPASSYLITFEPSAITATFERRYKRFFCDVLAPTIQPQTLTVHCANSGSMKSCLVTGAPCLILDSQNPERKLRYGLEGMFLEDGWACLNTLRANQAFRILMQNLRSSERSPESWPGYERFVQDFGDGSFRSEVTYDSGTRFDGCIDQSDGSQTWIEIKSVSLRLSPERIGFPDAVTERGARHLQKLTTLAEAGGKATLVYAIMRGSALPPQEIAEQFTIARDLDPAYAQASVLGRKAGVKMRLLALGLDEYGIFARGYFGFEPT